MRCVFTLQQREIEARSLAPHLVLATLNGLGNVAAVGRLFIPPQDALMVEGNVVSFTLPPQADVIFATADRAVIARVVEDAVAAWLIREELVVSVSFSLDTTPSPAGILLRGKGYRYHELRSDGRTARCGRAVLGVDGWTLGDRTMPHAGGCWHCSNVTNRARTMYERAISRQRHQAKKGAKGSAPASVTGQD